MLIGSSRQIIATDTNHRLHTNRRSFLVGFSAVLMTPAIVRATSLMNIHGEPLKFLEFIPCDGKVMHESEDRHLYRMIEGEMDDKFRENRIRFGLEEAHRDDRRRFGGLRSEGTFAVPDFRPFEPILGGPIELGRDGDLYQLDEATGRRSKIT